MEGSTMRRSDTTIFRTVSKVLFGPFLRPVRNIDNAKKRKLTGLLWPKYSVAIDSINRNAEMIAALQRFEAEGTEAYENKRQLYSAINKGLGNVGISYLEFGVWKGETLGAWTSLNTNENTRFYGFDSFEGLPEDWIHDFGRTRKGTFDLQGIAPAISDPRVTLVKGWFQHTLRSFLRDTQLSHPMVVHIDSDLHTSTHYVLSTIDPLLEAGDIIIFDEYASPAHEYFAWEQHKRAFMRETKCIAMADQWEQAAFVIL
jgi:O-methyltransferase